MAGEANYKGPGQPGHWYGYRRPKAERRSNGARPRKMHPFVTKDQKGTPMEYMIRNNNAEFESQYNAQNRGPGVMSANEASGRLGTHWGNIKNRMATGKKILEYMRGNKVSYTEAKNALLGLTDVHFAADPKNK